MRKRVLPVVTMLAALVVAVPWGFASTASAQTGPITCTVRVGSQDGGTHVVGTRFSLRFAPVCGFSAGDVVTLIVNDVPVAEKVSDADGTVTVRVFVESATRIQLEDPVPADVHLGTNTLTVSGFSPAANAFIDQTAVFNIQAATVATTTTVVATPVVKVTQPPAKLAFTGANILGLVALAAGLVVVGTLLVFSRRRAGSFRA